MDYLLGLLSLLPAGGSFSSSIRMSLGMESLIFSSLNNLNFLVSHHISLFAPWPEGPRLLLLFSCALLSAGEYRGQFGGLGRCLVVTVLPGLPTIDQGENCLNLKLAQIKMPHSKHFYPVTLIIMWSRTASSFLSEMRKRREK